MRCSCCNRNLNDYESTLKHSETGDYLDTCITCLDGLEVPFIGREDLNPFDRVDEYEDIDNYDDLDEDVD